jgi:hypothetical protein
MFSTALCPREFGVDTFRYGIGMQTGTLPNTLELSPILPELGVTTLFSPAYAKPGITGQCIIVSNP